MNLMKYRNIFVGIFLTTMVIAAVFVFINPYNGWGSKKGSSLNLGIDFTGGTKIYFPLSKPVTSDEVTEVLKTVDLANFKFNPPQPSTNVDSEGNKVYKVLVYTRFLNDSEQRVVLKALEAKFGNADQNGGLDISRVNPLIGKEIMQNALMAVLIASALMLIYIWIRFSSFVSGFAAVFALLHDALLVLGTMALFEKEINPTIIAAILTILGYSINDTIVIYDRIRENVKFKTHDNFVELANDSILQTFRRSLNTSFVTILAILVLFLVVPNLQEFCFAMIVGITSGTYSSIFVAAPIWAVFEDWQEKKKSGRKVLNTAR
jgi:protein-export membrane protein, SecD/SecF family